MLEVGLIGVGHWGPNIARSFELTGRARVAWLCDLDSARLESIAGRYPDAAASADVEELFRDEALSAVAISTPVTTHFDLARRALEAGKHVLLEKPLTRTSREAVELVRLARRRQRVLMVGHVFEYNSSVHALKDLIDSGELGNLHYLSFERTNLGPVRTDVNALWDLASHDISIMSYLLDELPADVTARGQSYLNPEIEDAVFAVFSFADGVLAHVNASWLNPRKIRRITVVGDRKMALWDDLELQRPIQIYDRHVEGTAAAETYLEYKTTVIDGGIYAPSVKLNRPLEAECGHFIDCVLESRTPLSDGVSGLRVVAALEAASASMENASALTAIELPRLDSDDGGSA